MGHVVRIFICLFASAFVGVSEAQTIHGWRGDGTGVDPTANPPLEWSKEKNVAWQTEVGRGFSSPVVVGGKVFVTAEPDELVCLDKTSGKILWRKSNGVKDLPAELQNRNLDLPTDCGYASPTPCSDGKFIFAFLGTGVVSCHDLDGNRKWIRLLEIEPKESNGRSASPVLFDDHLLVHASDLFCLDAKTGKTLWQKEAKPAFGTLAVAKVGDTEVAFIPMGDVFRLSDGEKLASNLAVCEVPSPVILDSAVYFIGGKAKALRVGMRASRVSEKEKRTAEVFTPENLWETNLNDEFYASPVIHNGFIYSVTKKGVYVVLDAKSGKKLLSHDLEIDSEFGPSISMAGDKLFVFTDSGVGHVIDPGATFKLLRKNILGDGTVATPAFDAERVFIRGEKKLWCIGKTGVGVTASAGSEGGNTAANSVNTEDPAKAVTPTPIQTGPPTYFTGWRGNGDGRFPDSSPPTQWGKVSKLLHGLRSSATKPKAETAAQGSPASSGAITEWLILGPLPAEESKGMEQAFFDEVTTQPDSGERVGDTSWKPFKTIENNLDFAALFGKDARGVAYAHSYLFAETEGKVLLSFNHYNNLKVWLNGEVAEVKNNAHSATLKEGWNRLLCKVDWAAQKGQYDIYPSLWYLGISIASLPPFEAETHNILWQARLPNWSISGPLIHGDRIYVMCEPNDLACFDKSDGRLLWIRSNNFYDALPEAEKGKAPFADIASRAARLKEVNESFVTGKWPDTNTLRERGNLNREINDLMAGIDKETYSRNWAEMHGYTVGTPVTDGEDIYIWIAYGIGARYDRDGNRKWIHFEQEMIKHHGYTSSPVLVDGKMIAYMKKLIALDMTTGKIVWRFDAAKDEKLYGDHFHETPIVIQSEGKNLIYVHGMLVRPGDGKVLFDNSTWKWKASIPTAITANGKLFQFNSGGNLMIAELPASASEPKLINTAKLSLFPEAGSAYKRTFLAASPLYHEGLLYVVDCMGKLSVVDSETQSIVYKRDLGIGLERKTNVHIFGTAFASPILMRDAILAVGMTGTMVVFKPGREYIELARNKIEHVTNPGVWYEKPEGFPASPVCEGDRLYLRGDGYLYCLGKPVKETFTGWRDNTTGLYPKATPVVEWKRKELGIISGLKVSALKPKGDGPGDATPIKNNEPGDWLVVGPFPAEQGLDTPTLPDEGALQPDDGDKIGDLAWARFTIPDDILPPYDRGEVAGATNLNFVLPEKLVGGFKADHLVYAHTWLHAGKEGEVELVVDHAAGLKIFLNGEVAYSKSQMKFGLGYYSMLGKFRTLDYAVNPSPRIPLRINKGWNRLLFKLHPPRQNWGTYKFNTRIVDVTGAPAEEKNVLWSAPLPDRSNATPLLVGNKLFVMAEPEQILCFDAKTGEQLWT